MSMRDRLFSFIVGAAALGLVAAMPSPLTAQEDCPRGTLDKQYCDRDGDQIADLPIDPADWINPDTLIFAYTPVEDPAVYKSVWAGFIDHMAKLTGKKVLFFSVQSNAAQLEAMRSGRLHVAGFNTGSNPIAVSCAGFSPFAMMASDDGSFGYEMEIIVPADSDMMTPADIKGRTLTFTSPTSNSGNKAPSALLKSEFGLIKDVDFETNFSGKHDNSVMGIANGDYEVASIANSVMRRMIDRGVVDPAKIRTIYKSQTFPTTGYGHVYNLDPTLAAQIKQAFFTFEWEGSALKEEFQKSGEGKFISIVHKFDWNVIRKIDSANGIEYACK